MKITHKFVEFIPDTIEKGTLYISIPYTVAVHQCPCGCGNEVATSLHPTGWNLTFNGKTVSLYPSIGNWNLPCQSHYWIREDKVVWAPKWSKFDIDAGRRADEKSRKRYFKKR